MALIDCWECGKKLSDAAPTCPFCGAPAKNATGVNEKDGLGVPTKGRLSCPKCGIEMIPRDENSHRTSLSQIGILVIILAALGTFLNPLYGISGIFGLILYFAGKKTVLVMVCPQCGEKKEVK